MKNKNLIFFPYKKPKFLAPKNLPNHESSHQKPFQRAHAGIIESSRCTSSPRAHSILSPGISSTFGSQIRFATYSCIHAQSLEGHNGLLYTHHTQSPLNHHRRLLPGAFSPREVISLIICRRLLFANRATARLHFGVTLFLPARARSLSSIENLHLYC